MKRFWVVFALLMLSGTTARAKAKPYALRTVGDTTSLVRTRDNRVVWNEKTADIRNYDGEVRPIWSANGRAVAFQDVTSFLVWREGGTLFEIPNPSIPGSNGRDHYDYTMGGVWSPDGRRFLARYGASGMSDVGPNGWGRVFCYIVGKRSARKFMLPSQHYAAKLGWRDSRTALYWILDEQNFSLISKPRTWRVPR